MGGEATGSATTGGPVRGIVSSDGGGVLQPAATSAVAIVRTRNLEKEGRFMIRFNGMWVWPILTSWAVTNFPKAGEHPSQFWWERQANISAYDHLGCG